MILLWVLAFVAYFFFRPQPSPSAPSPSPIHMVKQEAKADTLIPALIHYAHSLLGSPYLFNGQSPEGFDCSGYIGHVFSYKGFQLPRSSKAMARIGKGVKRDQIQQGDLVFFQGSQLEDPEIGHVGLVTETQDTCFQFIHAASRGVVVDDICQNHYFEERFVLARRPDYSAKK